MKLIRQRGKCRTLPNIGGGGGKCRGGANVVDSLNRMLEICNHFAAEHNLIFNTKKSLGIKYGDPVCASNTLYLGENKIRWESSVCHLDNYFNTTLSDMIDCKMKCSSFIGSVNRVMANFGHL